MMRRTRRELLQLKTAKMLGPVQKMTKIMWRMTRLLTRDPRNKQSAEVVVGRLERHEPCAFEPGGDGSVHIYLLQNECVRDGVGWP